MNKASIRPGGIGGRVGCARLSRATNVQPASLDLANALRVLALAQESLGQLAKADGSWREARSLYEAVGVLPGVHECDEHIARLGVA